MRCRGIGRLAVMATLMVASCGSPRPAPQASAVNEVTPSAQTQAATAETSTSEPAATADARSPIRRSAVAGSWYTDDPQELKARIDGMLGSIAPVDGSPIGLIVPHAGYTYSGRVAAVGFRQLAEDPPDVVVLLASDHQPPLSSPISVWGSGGFETPLGLVPVEEAMAQALLMADEAIEFDQAAHAQEHAIEIELPFLQRACPRCSIVPVMMGDDAPETVALLSEALLSMMDAFPQQRVALVASSDLSHYPSYDDALAVDGATLLAIETFDPQRVRVTTDELMASRIRNLATCACGRGPILVTMNVAREQGAETATILAYSNSADALGANGDRERVVGYGALMLWRYKPPTMAADERMALLELARSAIRVGETIEDPPAAAQIERRAGVFVTLKQDGELRGCIGHTRADLPLTIAVQEAAIAAANEDPRFPPLAADEMPSVTVEISVLSPFQRITSVEEVEIGTHGLLIVANEGSGLLLPQVPLEQGWDREAFLQGLCRKAGLPRGCWHNDVRLYSFTAIVFGDG